MNATNATAVTANGATQYHIDDVVEFFTQVGSSAMFNDLYGMFKKATADNKDLTIRSLLWSYDCRGGAGRRANFINIFPAAVDEGIITEAEARAIMSMIPELGRWDAVFKVTEAMKNKNMQSYALNMICEALMRGDKLCAKWMPRKGLMAARIRGFFNKRLNKPMSAKQYRKLLVSNTSVVETKMSANEWSTIDYEHVPSVAGARYRQAFDRHDGERHTEYIQRVAAGEAKMNTATLYPHDVTRMISSCAPTDAINTTWKAIQDIPNALGNVLCMADVSGSMYVPIQGSVTAVSAAVTLGIYFAQKSPGSWRNKILTFSGEPAIISLSDEDGFVSNYDKVVDGSPDPCNTDIRAAYREIVAFGKVNNVSNAEMPKALIILSDMQFDAIGPKSVTDDIKESFKEAGYDVPKLIYWNLNSYCNGVPIGSVLSEDAVEYSGYSPRGVETVLGSRTMIDVLLETVNIERYNWRPTEC